MAFEAACCAVQLARESMEGVVREPPLRTPTPLPRGHPSASRDGQRFEQALRAGEDVARKLGPLGRMAAALSEAMRRCAMQSAAHSSGNPDGAAVAAAPATDTAHASGARQTAHATDGTGTVTFGSSNAVEPPGSGLTSSEQLEQERQRLLVGSVERREWDLAERFATTHSEKVLVRHARSEESAVVRREQFEHFAQRGLHAEAARFASTRAQVLQLGEAAHGRRPPPPSPGVAGSSTIAGGATFQSPSATALSEQPVVIANEWRASPHSPGVASAGLPPTESGDEMMERLRHLAIYNENRVKWLAYYSETGAVGHALQLCLSPAERADVMLRALDSPSGAAHRPIASPKQLDQVVSSAPNSVAADTAPAAPERRGRGLRRALFNSGGQSQKKRGKSRAKGNVAESRRDTAGGTTAEPTLGGEDTSQSQQSTLGARWLVGPQEALSNGMDSDLSGFFAAYGLGSPTASPVVMQTRPLGNTQSPAAYRGVSSRMHRLNGRWYSE